MARANKKMHRTVEKNNNPRTNTEEDTNVNPIAMCTVYTNLCVMCGASIITKIPNGKQHDGLAAAVAVVVFAAGIFVCLSLLHVRRFIARCDCVRKSLAVLPLSFQIVCRRENLCIGSDSSIVERH